jgi:DNA end-binding protein Ku
MYSASDDQKVSFHQVHSSDNGRVRYRKFCEACGNELHADEIVKGYEVADRMIKFTDEEIDSLKPITTRSI